MVEIGWAEPSIQRLVCAEQAEACAKMMADSEPWITLGRGHEKALSMLTDTSREVYVAQDGEEALGFVALEMTGAFTGYVKSICVSPQHRGRGVGACLMAFAEERVFRESPNVFLCVSEFNEGARRFYMRLGYEEVGVLGDYIVRGHSEVLMRKTIGPLAEFEA